MNFDELRELGQKILNEAKKQDADAAQVNVSSRYNIGTRFGENHITQNTGIKNTEFSLKTQIGQKIGTYTGSFVNENFEQEIKNALAITKYSAPDEDYPGFIEEQPDYPPITSSYREIDPQELAEVINQIIEHAKNVDNRLQSVAGNLNFIAEKSIYLNSYGVEATDEYSQISGVINVAAIDDGESRSTVRIGGENIEELEYEKMATGVAETAVKGLHPDEIDPGKYEAVLGPEAVTQLLTYISMGASSELIINHTSFLKDKIGEQVFGEKFSILDDTQNPKHLANRRYDSEGTPSPEILFLDKGILKEYAYNRRNAHKLGVESNGRNATGFQGEIPLFYTPTIFEGDKSPQDLIEQIDNGVYITSFFYNNFVNPPEGLCTGLTRDGLFKIENGEIVKSLKNMRYTDKLTSIFGDVEPANDSRQVKGFFMGAAITPSMKVSQINFTSKGKH